MAMCPSPVYLVLHVVVLILYTTTATMMTASNVGVGQQTNLTTLTTFGKTVDEKRQDRFELGRCGPLFGAGPFGCVGDFNPEVYDQPHREAPFEHQTKFFTQWLSAIADGVAEDALQSLRTRSTGYGSPSPKCVKHVVKLYKDLLSGKPYAFAMLDAFGKPPSGILKGSLVWLGSFDECVGTRAVENKAVLFSGRYCLMQFKSQILWNATHSVDSIGVGLCLPDSCGLKDVSDLVTLGLSLLKTKIPIPVDIGMFVCSIPGQYTWGTYVALILCGLLLLLGGTGTGFDLYTQWRAQSGVVPARRRDYGSLEVDPNSLTSLTESGSLRVPENDRCIFNGRDGEKGVCSRLLMSFSMRKNLNEVFNVDRGQGKLQCLHGIRVLSLWWVILGHTCLFAWPINFQNIADVRPLFKTFLFQMVPGSIYSVDSFFLMAGLLVTFLTLRQLPTIDGTMNWVRFWIKFYIHRYWRLTPLLMFAVLIWTTVLPHMTDGPMWGGFFQTDVLDLCRHKWWTNLLYLNNFVPGDINNMCMAWSWYLAIDMQFYITSPILVYLLYRYPRVGKGLVVLLVLMSVTIRGGIARYWKLTPIYNKQMRSPTDYQMGNFLYLRPFTRASPYLVGVMLGYVLKTTEFRVKIPKVLVAGAWGLSLGAMVAVVFGEYGEYKSPTPYSPDVHALYIATCHLTWAMSLAWVVFACCNGYGGFVNSLLCWKVWEPFSRLTYSAYLFHPMVIWIHYLSHRQLIYVSGQSLMYLFVGHVVMGYAAALPVVLLMESPCTSLGSIFIKKRRPQTICPN